MWIITNLKSFNKSTFCLKIYRQNIIKKIKKNHKKARKTYQNLSKEEEEKKETIWSWTLQLPFRRWITEACWV